MRRAGAFPTASLTSWLRAGRSGEGAVPPGPRGAGHGSTGRPWPAGRGRAGPGQALSLRGPCTAIRSSKLEQVTPPGCGCPGRHRNSPLPQCTCSHACTRVRTPARPSPGTSHSSLAATVAASRVPDLCVVLPVVPLRRQPRGCPGPAGHVRATEQCRPGARGEAQGPNRKQDVPSCGVACPTCP